MTPEHPFAIAVMIVLVALNTSITITVFPASWSLITSFTLETTWMFMPPASCLLLFNLIHGA
jgi:type II secretory pathway component PulC